MADTSNTIPPKGLWTLRLQDLWKGFIKSCGGLLVGLIIKFIQAHGQLPAYAEIEPFLEAAAYFFLGYLGLNAATNNVGQLFKADQPVMTVDKEHYENLKEKAAQADSIPTLPTK